MDTLNIIRLGRIQSFPNTLTLILRNRYTDRDRGKDGQTVVERGADTAMISKHLSAWVTWRPANQKQDFVTYLLIPLLRTKAWIN